MSSLTDQIGRVLAGRYRLVAPVGTGASAHVYAADDVVLSRRVAVKVLHPALVGDQGFLRRFRAEARAAAALNHPHVMRVFDWGEDADGPFLVLEHLGGGSLRDLLDAGHLLSVSQVAQIGAQAAHGLAYAHRRGIVHRDVKPANILFDDEGSLRVADFGLARALAEAAWTEPTGAVLGTARYASPEQAEGRIVDDRADVYSLALVLFESVTGWVPFSADTTVATLMARLGAHLPMLPELGPLGPILAQAAIPEPLARLDAAGLAVDLEILARDLDPPAPLPLAGPSRRWGGPPRDPTLVGDPPVPDRLRAVEEGLAAGGGAGAAGAMERSGTETVPDHASGRDVPVPEAPQRVPMRLPPAPRPPRRSKPAAQPGPAAGAAGPAAAAGAAGPAAAAGAAGAAPAAGPAAAGGAPPAPPRQAPPATAPTSRPPAQPAPASPARPATGPPPAQPGPAGTPAAALAPPRARPTAAAPRRAAPTSRRPAQPAPPAAAATASRRGRRWWIPAAAAVLVVVLLLMAAAGGLVSYRQWVSGGKVVPSFVGRDLAAVQSAAAAADLRVAVAGKRYDAQVPAGEVISQSVKAGSHLPGGTLVSVTLSEGAAPVPVPSLDGDDAAQAQQALKQAGLVGSESAAQYSETVAAGIVIGWSPRTGLHKLGSTVTFWVSLGPKPRIVPDLVGWTWPNAQSDLEGMRLQPVEQLQYSNTVKAGYVISTVPGANVTVQRGAPVDVVVSRGPQYVVVPPDLYGMTESQARSALAQLGLPLGGTYGIGSTVIASEPTPGSRVKVGTPVFLYLF